MVDITLRYRGDASGAVAASRDVTAANEELAGGVDEATDSLREQSEASDKAAESQDGLAVTMRDVVKAAKEVVKFVGDSVKEYLKSADAQKELIQVSKDLEEAQTNLKKTVGETALAFAKEAQLAEAAQGALGLIQTVLKGDTQENIDRETRLSQVIEARAALASAKANELNLKTQAASDMVDEAEIRLRELTTAQGLTPSLADSAAARLLQRQKEDLARKAAQEAADAARAAANEQLQIVVNAANTEFDTRKKGQESIAKMMQGFRDDALKAEQQEADAILKIEQDRIAKEYEAQVKGEEASAEASAKQGDAVIAEAKRNAEAQQRAFANIGNTVGAAFVNAFTDMLNSMLDGGKNDPTKTLLTVLDAFWAVAGAIIGGVSGNPALGSAISGIGSTVTHGIAAAANSKAGASKLTAHNGAWVGAPKYHDGGWAGLARDEVPAILKKNERVLSDMEVDRMGGPASVDRAAAGNMGGMQVFVTAIDSKSATEAFARDLGKAQRRVQISGYGALSVPR